MTFTLSPTGTAYRSSAVYRQRHNNPQYNLPASIPRQPETNVTYNHLSTNQVQLPSLVIILLISPNNLWYGCDSLSIKVEGLDIGADDYVTKPFSASELAARVRAILRRTRSQERQSNSLFRYKDLAIDYASNRVSMQDKELILTSTEYRLLSYISQNAGRVVTPDQLLNKVWGEAYLGAPHLLQVNIARLRKKLGDDARNPTYILTRPGIGYIMVKPWKTHSIIYLV